MPRAQPCHVCGWGETRRWRRGQARRAGWAGTTSGDPVPGVERRPPVRPATRLAGSRAVARALRAALSAIALMARRLPPLAHAPGGGGGGAGPELASVPQLGLLVANDLDHLAASLLLLSQVTWRGVLCCGAMCC
jgi:hypothetical protein